jgi:hypothetical protein
MSIHTAMIENGQKFKIVITLDCELVTDEPGATKEQIRDIMFADPSYGLKSIVVGTINPNSKDDHDTEIMWDSTTIEVV